MMPVMPPPTIATSAVSSSFNDGWFVDGVVSIHSESDSSEPAGSVIYFFFPPAALNFDGNWATIPSLSVSATISM